jgi:hypothetical protein
MTNANWRQRNDLANVSRGCKLIGHSRQQFYENRRNFQTYGAEGLIDRLGPHPNRGVGEIEQAVWTTCWCNPCHGAVRVGSSCGSGTAVRHFLDEIAAMLVALRE